MFRTDAEGNVSGLYTEGNPATGVPATVVSADAMNAIQEEICNIIESAGLTLSKTNDEQLKAAINSVVQGGGITPVEVGLLNDESEGEAVTGVNYNGANTRAIMLDAYVYRRDDVEELAAIMKVYMFYKPDAAAWTVSWDSQGDSTGVTFAMDGNQLNYKTDAMAGSNYIGRMLFTTRKIVNVT